MSSNAMAQWWKESVIYQIYPSSFKDSNGDGWGDIVGITQALDYLKNLGIDIIWLSPIYKSPQADMGYDIADYKDIDPAYGSLEDVETLIKELKKRNMRLVMDLVVNHTSDQHAWFVESRSSLQSPKRDWYIWRKGKLNKNGQLEPPNNWCQILGEANSAWTYDESTDEYYLSLFTPEQPDLNWENPEVREAVHDVMRFWLDKGVSGFRMDVINLISKVQSFPDAEPVLEGHKYHPGVKYFANGPRLHEYLQELNRKVLSKYDCLTVGEMPFISDMNEIMKVVGSDRGELQMIFIFDLVEIDRYHSAKLLALMETTLSGTLFVYQGEEIGMRNAPPEWDPEEYKDIEAVNLWKKYNAFYAQDSKKLAEGRNLLQRKARDHARTPMQWTSGPNAGFCDSGVKPWMRVNDDWREVNAEAQQTHQVNVDNDLSVWQFWQRGLKNRKEHKDAFVYGDFKAWDIDHESIFAYSRTAISGETWLIVLNFSSKSLEWKLPVELQVEKWVASNYTAGSPGETLTGSLQLRPWEGMLGHCH